MTTPLDVSQHISDIIKHYETQFPLICDIIKAMTEFIIKNLTDDITLHNIQKWMNLWILVYDTLFRVYGGPEREFIILFCDTDTHTVIDIINFLSYCMESDSYLQRLYFMARDGMHYEELKRIIRSINSNSYTGLFEIFNNIGGG